MTWEQFVPDWSPGDVDAASVWAACGGQRLTDPEVAVPVDLVNGVVGIASWLDAAGARLGERFDGGALGVLTARAATQEFAPALGRANVGGASRLIRCADGWIAISLARPDDFASVPAWLGVEFEDWSTIEKVVASASTAMTVKRAGLLGLACAAVGERVARGCGCQMESLGDAAPKRVDQLVVANLASLWAGPLAADVLARCGARVLTVESTSRPDGARAWPEFFDDLHSNCEFVVMDFTTDAGRRELAELLQRVDVVIEGSRPRALEQLGLDARTIARNGPQLWVSITGHGRDAQHAHRIGFGDDAAAAGGLVGWVNDEPRFLADAIADPITGLTAAATIIQLAGRGGRWLVDAPLAAIAASYAGADQRSGNS